MNKDLEQNKLNAIAFYETAYLGDPAKAVDAGFDGRVSAIAFASCRMFKALEKVKAWAE